MRDKPSTERGAGVMEARRPETFAPAESRATNLPIFKLKTILVPTDFSECSRKALRYAIPFATQFNAAIELLHVVHVNYVGGEFGMIDYPLQDKELREAGEQQMESLVRDEIQRKVPVRTSVRSGPVVNQIIEAASEMDVDLIIISTHGYTGLKHVFMGSVAEHVVRHAPCPVLIVREHEHEFVAP